MRFLTPLLLAAALPVASFAGTATFSASGKDKTVQPVECVPATLNTIIATTDYGFHQDLKRGSGNMEVEHNDFELDRRIPLNFCTWPNVQCGQWFLRLGADYERFDFSIHNETRLPDTLQSASGIIALEYIVNNDTAFLIETRPGVYFQQKVNTGSFDSPHKHRRGLSHLRRDQFLPRGRCHRLGALPISRFPHWGRPLAHQ
jgi:hypothetical protein